MEGSFRDEDLETDSFDSESEGGFDIIYNMVSILPDEYNLVSKVPDRNQEEIEMASHRPICYFVMNNGCIEEKIVFFERSGDAMKSHLKTLFIRAKVYDVPINKILIDGGVAVNLMPQFLLSKIGKCEEDLKPHNMVLSNYEEKTGQNLGVLQVNLTMGSITRLKIFLVIDSKASYNMLLGREWIHGIGVVPSSLHQRVSIWRSNGIVEHVEGYQGYFMDEVNNIIGSNFDRNLANIMPFSPPRTEEVPLEEAFVSLKLHPTLGFFWD